jgi:hypothetical protein
MLTIRMYLRIIVKGDRAIKGECWSEAKRRTGIERRGRVWVGSGNWQSQSQHSPLCAVCGMERLWVYYCRVSSHTAQ